MDNIDHLKDKIIKAQDHLIQLFDTWVLKVKANELEEAKEIKDLANIVRNEIRTLKSDLEKLKNRKIILLKN